MRIFSAATLLAVAGCDAAPPGSEALAKLATGEAAAAGRIACAPAGAAEVQPLCSVDRTRTAQGLILTLRNPDGGFHRLQVTGDGRGVIAADGAEKAAVRIVNADEIDVTIGGDRYRLPATIGAPPKGIAVDGIPPGTAPPDPATIDYAPPGTSNTGGAK